MNNATTNKIDNSLINSLESITVYVMTCGGIFILIVGNVGCIGNLIVFRSQAYRRQACFIYLFWETISSFFILNMILLTRILESGFKIPVMDAFDPICRIREFISLFMYQNENSLFLFATLDRILSAQRSMKLRKWSNRVPLAYKIIVVNALFWILVTSHRLIFYTNSIGSCWSQNGAYRTFDTFLDVSFSAVGSPFLVIILTLMLWLSVRSVTKRHATRNSVAPAIITPDQSRHQQADLQITTMLLMQSILAIINYVPFGGFILYVMFTDGVIKSPLRVAWENIIIAFIRLSSYLFAAGTFYISIISSHAFRQQFKDSFRMRKPIHPASIANTNGLLINRTNALKPAE